MLDGFIIWQQTIDLFLGVVNNFADDLPGQFDVDWVFEFFTLFVHETEKSH